MALFLTVHYFIVNVKRIYDILQPNKKKDGPLAIDSKETLEKEDVQAIEKDGMIYTTLPKKQFMNVIVSVSN